MKIFALLACVALAAMAPCRASAQPVSLTPASPSPAPTATVPFPAAQTYTPFLLSFGGPNARHPMGETLQMNEDASLVVDWDRLAEYAEMHPIDRNAWPWAASMTQIQNDANATGSVPLYRAVAASRDMCRRSEEFSIAVLVHALLAEHQGRVTCTGGCP